MTILHPSEIRDMTPAEREAELEDLDTELLNAKSVLAAGGMPDNPGRVKELRRTIARIKTIQNEEGDLDAEIDDDAVAAADTTAAADEEAEE
ncbi:50S ribosomal protein L29 [Halobacteriales archaeon Cl-PHB]